MKEKLLYVGLGLVLGVVLGPQLMRVPGVSKIPTL
jgi:hypothetical protein